jgi:hypothetical protein
MSNGTSLNVLIAVSAVSACTATAACVEYHIHNAGLHTELEH